MFKISINFSIFLNLQSDLFQTKNVTSQSGHLSNFLAINRFLQKNAQNTGKCLFYNLPIQKRTTPRTFQMTVP
jgi:hypothetical protein